MRAHTFVLRKNSRWDSTTDACRCRWSADYACTHSSYAKPTSFAKKRPVRRQTLVDVGAGGVLLMPACCIPSASLRKSYLLLEKTANRVVRGLKLKLKTSPTKVRLASLKKIWKQAGRRHERRDGAVAESADFAAFDLRNRTSRDGYSNACRTGFHLSGSTPNSDDVRRREIPEKSCQKSKKQRDHFAPRCRCKSWQIPVPLSWRLRGRYFPACIVPRVVTQVPVVGYVAPGATDIAIAKIERLIGVQVVQTLQGLLGIHTTARVWERRSSTANFGKKLNVNTTKRLQFREEKRIGKLHGKFCCHATTNNRVKGANTHRPNTVDFCMANL